MSWWNKALYLWVSQKTVLRSTRKRTFVLRHTLICESCFCSLALITNLQGINRASLITYPLCKVQNMKCLYSSWRVTCPNLNCSLNHSYSCWQNMNIIKMLLYEMLTWLWLDVNWWNVGTCHILVWVFNNEINALHGSSALNALHESLAFTNFALHVAIH